MKKSTLIILITLVTLSNTKILIAQEENKNQMFFPNTIHVLDREVPKLQIEQNVPTVGLSLIENGKVKFIKVYGEHQYRKSAPKNTIFNVASITKVITTMTTLRLIDQGKWKLDEPLYNYWVDSDLKNDPRYKKLTTRHSLSHTTGFKNWRRMNASGKLEIDFEPGTKYQYSGEGMEYLKEALENKFGMDLEQLAKSLIFNPLEMDNSTLKWLTNEQKKRFAKWYDGNGKEHNARYNTYNVSAADDLLTTVEDLSKFGIAVMNNTIINKTLFKEMVKPQIDIHHNAQQGLGWTIVNNLPNENYAINHDGGDTGVATTIILLPNSKSGIIVFTNGDNGRIICNAIVKKAITFGDEIIQKLYWGGEIPKVITINNDLLKKYSGSYQTNQNTRLSFIVKNNALKIEGEGVPGVEIYPKSNNEFFPTDFEVFFKFTNVKEGVKFELINQGKVVLEGIKNQ